MINRFKWLEIKPETRKNIVVFLSDVEGFPPLKKSGGVEVAGNRVICDGYTDKDLCAITPELLRQALDEKTFESCGVNGDDIYSMFYELVRRIELPIVEIEPLPETNNKLDEDTKRMNDEAILEAARKIAEEEALEKEKKENLEKKEKAERLVTVQDIKENFERSEVVKKLKK